MTREEFFEKLRRAVPGIWNRPGAIEEGNELFDVYHKPAPPSEPEMLGTPQRIGPRGTALIKDFEGLHRVRTDGLIEAYPDPGTGGAPWTIGWGATGPDIAPGTVWTRKQADEWFDKHIIRYADDVKKALGSALEGTSQPQFDAMVSFHYNTGAIGRATLTKMHKAGNYAGAAREFDKWIRAGGRVMKGLVRRRAAERKMYESGL